MSYQPPPPPPPPHVPYAGGQPAYGGRSGMSTGKRIVIGLTALFVAMCCAGGALIAKGVSDASDDFVAAVSGSPASGQIGETLQLDVNLGSGEVTATEADRIVGACSEFGDEPAHGGYRVFNIRVTAETGKVAVNPMYWALIGADGTLYGPHVGCSGLPESFFVPAGATMDMTVVIDAPEDTGGALVLSDEALNEAVRWSL